MGSVFKNLRSDDPYLVLRGVAYNPNTKIAGYVDKIMRKSEWKAAGFGVSTDKHGNYKPFKRNGLCYRLRSCLDDMLTAEQLNSLGNI